MADIRDRVIELRKVPARELAVNPLNWRKHPKRQREALGRILGEIGFAGAALAYYDGDQLTLIDGHLRQDMVDSDFEMPVAITDLTADEAEVLLASYDPIAALAEANKDKQAALRERIAAKKAEFAAMVDAANGVQVVQDVEGDDGGQVDQAEALLEKWQVVRGDLWAIGEHRLLCGDSTSADDVARVMGGEKARMIHADPPYGVDYERGKFDGTARKSNMPTTIANDHLKGAEQQSFICDVFKCAQKVIIDNAVIYMWSAPLVEGAHSMMGLIDAGVHVQSQLIWNKSNLVLGRGDYHWKHEVCWYGYWSGKDRVWNGGRDQTTVIDAKKIAASFHPNEKPVELVSYLVGNSSNVGDVVYDPFGGSGTTMVACEQLGRACRMIEIEPKYCAVILERMAGVGLEPVRAGDNGHYR